MLFMDRSQTGGDLARNFQSDLWRKPPTAFDQVLERFPFRKLHRIEIAVTALPKMKHGSNIGMANAGRCSCLAYKAPASRFVADKPGVNHLQRNRTSQVDIDCLVSHSHRTAAQLQQRSIFPSEDFVMVESRCQRRSIRADI